MTEYTALIKDEHSLSLCFYIDKPEIMRIGEKMNVACEDAYMNGYNWEAFFNYYLQKRAPGILEDMASDPEASMYVAYWPPTAENETKAEEFMEIIHALVENEEDLCHIVREHGSEIEWD